MLKQMKKTLGILLVVCFLMSVTAAAVSAEPVVFKEKKVVAVNSKTGQNIITNGVAVKGESGQKIVGAKGIAVNSKTGKKIASKGVAMDSGTGPKIVPTKKVAMKNDKDKAINS
jgi:hypothetical protein